jgi:hypothetical protein
MEAEDPTYFRLQADRCLRFAASVTSRRDADLFERMADEYLERAAAHERRADKASTPPHKPSPPRN